MPSLPSVPSDPSVHAGRVACLPPAGTLVVTETETVTETRTESVTETRTETGRDAASPGLSLRPWRPDDAPAVVRGTDVEYRRWNTPKLLVETEADALEWMRRRADDYERGAGCVLAVTEGDRDDVIGGVGLGVLDLWMRHGTVGYWVLPEARGRGVARRALELFTRWAFTEVGLHRVSLGHAVGHEVSCRVAERCGYRYEGTLRGQMFEAGDTSRFRDTHLHARLATDA